VKRPSATLLPLALLLGSCSQDRTTGTTMETENAVAVRILDPSGQPVAGVAAHLRPLWYQAGETAPTAEARQGIVDLATDADGWLRFPDLPRGSFRLEVGTGSRVASLEFRRTDTTSSVELNPVELAAPGRLGGRIALPEGVRGGWIRIHGSELQAPLDSTGSFRFDALPSGPVRLQAVVADGSTSLAEGNAWVRSAIASDAGTLPRASLTTEDPETWRHERVLALSSLVSDWMLPLSDPTVLTLRLDASNFDFSQASGDGRDLRLTDGAGTPLPHQRVRWDSARAHAVVRLRVSPRLAPPLIRLRWGRPGAFEAGTTQLWTGLPDSLRLALTSVPLGTFETPSPRTDLPRSIPATYWYTLASDSATVSPAPQAELAPAFQAAGKGRAGKALHLVYQATSPAWVALGTGLKGQRSFGTLDSVVFWARGSGRLSFALDNLSGSGVKAWAHHDLDTAWTRVRVRPADFLPAKAGSEVVSWQTIQDSVTHLTFLASGGTDVWLDDVSLFGIGIDDLK